MNKKENSRFYKLLISSVISIVLFTAIFAGTTFAWFSASYQSGENTITLANYSLDINILLDSTEVPISGQIYSLESGNTYNITLSTTGTASTGYCKIELMYSDASKNQTLYTSQIANGESLSFTFSTTDAVSVKFTACLGTSIKFETPDITNLTNKII